MTAMIHDPQHGYLRQATQGDYDNLLAENATLKQQLSDLQTQMGVAASSAQGGATGATPAGGASVTGAAADTHASDTKSGGSARH